MTPPPLLGIFVGGKSRRMGGHAKGLLPGPDGRPLLVRLVSVGTALGLETVLVGDASPYATLELGLPAVPDRVPGQGPLGGLAALVTTAADRRVLALSCDLPFVVEEDVQELVAHPSTASVVCATAREGAPLEPLFARYEAARVRAAIDAQLAGAERSLQALLRTVGAASYVPTRPGALRDWDTPEDVARGFDEPARRG